MSAQSSAASVPHSGFVMIDNEVIDSCELSPRAISLYVTLSRHVNREIGLAWPSIERLCALTCMARATVVKYIKELETKGWIQVLRSCKPHSRERAVNRYRVLNPKRVEAAEPAGAEHELPPQQPAPAPLAGSSNHEREVVQMVNEGSSNLDSPVVQDLDGIQTQTQKDQMNETESNQRVPAHCAAEAAAEAAPSTEDRCAAPPKTEASQTRKQLAWEAFCYALADVCHLDFEANQGKIHKVASRLWKNGKGYNPIDVRSFKKWWYANDWRGKKGDIPTLQNVVELIRMAVEADSTPETEPWKRLLGQGQYSDIVCY